MKKTSIFLLILGIGILYGLSFLFPIPAVNPIHIQNQKETNESREDSEGTDPDAEEGMSAGRFVFPYYQHRSDQKPVWVFKGDRGSITRGEQQEITVHSPRIKYFPSRRDRSGEEGNTSDQVPGRVTISGRTGRKTVDNVAFVKGNARVETGRGGTLTTRQLYADFDTDRLYTKSDHRVQVERSGLSIEGTGFTGNSRLSEYKFEKDVYMQLSPERIRKLASGGNTEPTRSVRGQQYVISGSGPFKARLVDETAKRRAWKLSIYRNVFLYRVLEKGTLHQTSDELHIKLIERKQSNQDTSRSDTSPDRDSNLRIRSIEAIGTVRLHDPNIDIHSDHVTMNRKRTWDVFHLKGNSQFIQLHEKTNRASGRNSSDTTIYVSGTGRIERTRSTPDSGNERREGNAEFNGQVFVNRRGARLQSNDLSIAFTERSAPPKNEREKKKNTGLQPRDALRVRMLEARENVLFLSNQIASTGEHLTWLPPTGSILLTSPKKSIITDLRNRIIAGKIDIDRSQRTFSAGHNVRTTFRMNRKRGFQLLGQTSGKRTEQPARNGTSENSDTKETTWHLNADNLSFRMGSGTNRLRSLQAHGSVRISSDQGKARGDRFVLDRSDQQAILHGGKRKATVSQNRHRALADTFRFRLDHHTVVLKGQKRLRIDLSSASSPEDPSQNRVPPSNYLQVTTGAPFIIHRRKGRVRVLGPARVLKPNGQLRSGRLYIKFNPESNQVRTVRATEHVFLGDMRGSARGDLLRWSPADNRLMLRGQPHAVVNRGGNSARFEIIRIWNNWNNLRGKRYKWQAPGSIQGTPGRTK